MHIGEIKTQTGYLIDTIPFFQNGTELTGNVVLSGVVTSQDGGVNFDPIPGDLLRTMHDTPQVRGRILSR